MQKFKKYIKEMSAFSTGCIKWGFIASSLMAVAAIVLQIIAASGGFGLYYMRAWAMAALQNCVVCLAEAVALALFIDLYIKRGKK